MADETKLADRGDDVKSMSDEELVEALETLAEQFCGEAGFATVPVKLHGLEIRHRLESLRERVAELEALVEDGISIAEDATAWEVRDYMGEWVDRARPALEAEGESDGV